MRTQPFRGFQHSGNSRCIIICPVVDSDGVRGPGGCSGSAHSKVVMMGPDDHILVLEALVRSFEYRNDIGSFHKLWLQVHADIDFHTRTKRGCCQLSSQSGFKGGEAVLSGC